jgi:hypothetical protein
LAAVEVIGVNDAEALLFLVEVEQIESRTNPCTYIARISDLAVVPYPAEQASSLDLPGL